ncbi:hypothetical protein [Dongia sp.]|uniref:hypothetical protein n=1 Tax=Dongia sp. TaxID=1977262 RepID=UPI0035AF2F35
MQRLTKDDKIRYGRQLATYFARNHNTKGAIMADGIVQHILDGKKLTASQYSWFQHNLYIHMSIKAPLNDADNEDKRGAGRPAGSKTKREVSTTETLWSILDGVDDCIETLTGDSNG